MTLRVTNGRGNVLFTKTQSTGANGFMQLESSECPDGFLAAPRAHARLDAEISEQGGELTNGDDTIHVPRGYFSPGFVSVTGTSTFRALSSGTLEHESQGNGAHNTSNFEIPRGLIQLTLPSETTISVGINPSMQSHFGYERTIDVTLRAAGR